MMTYFAEYPVIIAGYGLGDSNVNAVIADLGEAIKDNGGVLENVYYIEWVQDILSLSHLKEEHVFPVASSSFPALRVRTIVTSDFEWIFEALAEVAPPVSVNVKLLRHLAARVVDLVRTDVPKNRVEIDYARLEKLSDDPTELALVLGISNVSNPNLDFPYCLDQVANKLGYPTWQRINKLVSIADEKVGFKIRSSDNEYHLAIKSGRKAISRKFSEKFVRLLRDVIDEYKLENGQ